MVSMYCYVYVVFCLPIIQKHNYIYLHCNRNLIQLQVTLQQQCAQCETFMEYWRSVNELTRFLNQESTKKCCQKIVEQPMLKSKWTFEPRTRRSLREDVIKHLFAVPTNHAHRRSIGRWAWAAGWALARLSALPSAHVPTDWSHVTDGETLRDISASAWRVMVHGGLYPWVFHNGYQRK